MVAAGGLVSGAGISSEKTGFKYLQQHNNNNHFMALCLVYPGEPVPEETLIHPPS